MPLKCLNGNAEVYSSDFVSKESWESLRQENAATNVLHMSCCGANVVLKTSPLGTRYFAHARKGPCKSAPESPEHLLAKKIILEGLSHTDWIAKPEQGGETPTGEQWTADVLASNGKLKVAFEVQWSRQADDETRRRQARYNSANVRALWLFRQKDFPFGKDVPAFQIILNENGTTFHVAVPDSGYVYSRQRMFDSEYWTRHWQLVELSLFAAGAVSGKLKFAPAYGRSVPFEVYATPTVCRRCKATTRIVTRMMFKVSTILPGHPDIPTSLWAFESSIPKGTELIADLLPRSLLAKHGIGAIKIRKSYLRVENEASYLSNGCVRCDGLQPRHFAEKLDPHTEELALTTNVVLEEEWAFT